MKCKKLIILSGTLLLAFFVSFVFCPSSVFATDPDFTIDSSTSSFYFCGNNQTYSCNDYSYLVCHNNVPVDYSLIGSGSSIPQVQLQFYVSNLNPNYVNRQQNFYLTSNDFIYSLVSGNSSHFYGVSFSQVSNSQNMPANWSITCTLKTSLSDGIIPSGSLDITNNGNYDVTNYSEVNVNVPQTPATYHDDLAEIKKAILIGSATLLVLYFFYCIYRIIISYGGSR